jgi:type I restriction enzyme S subunit
MNEHGGLPSGWTLALLREVATINPTNPANVPEDDTRVSFVPMAAVEELSGRMNASMTRSWSDVRKGFTRFQDGDVVFAKITPSMENGKVALAANLINGVAAGTTEFHVFRPQSGVKACYLLHYLLQETFRRRARGWMTGTAGQLRVPTRFLEEEVLPLAPAPEQQRIVEAIDSYLTRLDDVVASLERVQAKLKAYRASVLKAAVEGRLVPTEASLARAEKRDYEPADALLARILQERRRRWEEAELAKFKAAGRVPKDDRWKAKYEEPMAPDTSELPNLPDGWCWARISTVGHVQLGRQRAPAHHHGAHMRPYLRVANVFEGRIDTSDVKRMNFSPDEYETYHLEPGDILLNEGQSPHLVGRPAIYRGEVPGACFQNTLIRFKAAVGVDFRLALLVFRAQLHARRFMRIAQITTNIAHLGAGRFADVEFPLPPIGEQRRIADEADRLLSIADETESSVRHQKARATRLRQSLLKWAFEGKLVEQDPTDEPAEQLLARIRAERAPANPPRKTGRRGRGAA